jgi:hypothetical protein
MTDKEKKILNEFYFNKITKEEFLKQYPVDITKNKRHIFLSVKEAYNNKDANELDLALTLIIFNTTVVDSDEFVELLCLLLKERWHPQHENIVTILQGIKSPKSIDTLYQTALTRFDSVAYMETYSLARKCIHALGDINTEYAKEKLRLLAESDVPVIKEKAEKQLYYYKR